VHEERDRYGSAASCASLKRRLAFAC
jgi:hypothetical protein